MSEKTINIELLINSKVEDVIKSPDLTIMLLKFYSAMYLNGKQPGGCESCIRAYHAEIIKSGKMKAELLEEIKKRTCIPSFTGLYYSTILHEHILPEMLTDNKAIDYLNRGILKEKHFSILPEGYKKPQNINIDRPKETTKENFKPKKNKK